MGLGTIGWGFSKMDGVPVGLVESQWGWLKVNGVVVEVNGVDFRWGCYRR